MSLLLLFNHNTGGTPPPPADTGTSTGGDGGFGWKERLRRSVNFEDMYRHVDFINNRKEKERREALAKLNRTIEAAFDNLGKQVEKAKDPPPVAVAAIKTAKAVSAKLVEALAQPKGKLPAFDVDAVKDQIEFLERQVKAAQERMEAQALEEDDDEV